MAGVSRPCDECGKVKRCTMHRDELTGEMVYLCKRCARELE